MLTLEETCAELNKKQSDQNYSPQRLRELVSDERELEKIHRHLWMKLCELERQEGTLT
jgi:hypothetical protein